MSVAVIQELHELLDTLPERSLYALKPLITLLSEEPVIETDLTAEERALIEEGMQEYKRDPSSFTTLESLLK